MKGTLGGDGEGGNLCYGYWLLLKDKVYMYSKICIFACTMYYKTKKFASSDVCFMHNILYCA